MFRRRKRIGGFPTLDLMLFQAFVDLVPFFLALFGLLLVIRRMGWPLPFWTIVLAALAFDCFYWRVLRKNDEV